MKILAIMVRYRMPLSESPTLQGLCDALSSQPDLAQSYDVMIWDNSPEATVIPRLPIQLLYKRSQTNLGVSAAYNGAMEWALEQGYPWLLLLDQDTKVSPEFLITMLRHSVELAPRREIAAVAPTVRSGETLISPSRRLLGRNRSYPAGECGIAPGEVTAINSGCIMRVSSLWAIGGFSLDFWLDYSDEYVFHQFFVQGLKVWRAADVELDHDLSIMDYGRLMSPWRYRNFSSAESAFADFYRSRLDNAILTLRLFARAIKHQLKYKNLGYSRIAWGQFMYRLRAPRTERIARWRAESKRRFAQQTDSMDKMQGPILQ